MLTNKLTDKQTPLKTSTSLRYATPMGNELSKDITVCYCRSFEFSGNTNAINPVRALYNRTLTSLIMVALWNRADHYIFMLLFLLLLLLSSFFSSPNLSRRRLDVCHTSTHGVAYSANLGCRFETCCTRLAENTGRKKVAKNRNLVTIACRAKSSQLRHVSTIGKKLVKQQYLL